VSSTTQLADANLSTALKAMESARRPGRRWPLIAYYGPDRFSVHRRPGGRPRSFGRRSDGYADCLRPSAKEQPLWDWIEREIVDDTSSFSRGDPTRDLTAGVFDAMLRGTPGLETISYSYVMACPIASFDDGTDARWSDLPDGYRVFMGMVGDIGRRTAILNSLDGASAPLHVEGVVLIDELDLHLHPRWQRTVIRGLRAAFPKLQFIVTTHSPQVLSSVENRQVRLLSGHTWHQRDVFVEGRDTNAILRDLMDTDDRDERGKHILSRLYAHIDDGNIEGAQTLLGELRRRWGSIDPEIIRAEGFLDEERRFAGV